MREGRHSHCREGGGERESEAMSERDNESKGREGETREREATRKEKCV